MTESASVYANALYDLAREDGACDDVLQQLRALGEAFSREPAYLRLLGSCDLSKAERCAIVEQGFRGNVHPYVLNVLRLMIEKGHIGLFPDCIRRYEAVYNEQHGILPVQVYCAQAPDVRQLARLKEKLQSVTGKTVVLEVRQEDACIGGIRLCYDGKCVDGTVRSRLDAMRDLLTSQKAGIVWN